MAATGEVSGPQSLLRSARKALNGSTTLPSLDIDWAVSWGQRPVRKKGGGVTRIEGSYRDSDGSGGQYVLFMGEEHPAAAVLLGLQEGHGPMQHLWPQRAVGRGPILGPQRLTT